KLQEYEFISELSLSGVLRGVPVVLPMAIACHQKKRALMVAPCNAEQAILPGDNLVWVADNLKSVCRHLLEEEQCKQATLDLVQQKSTSKRDMREIHGQIAAKKALEIAASGGHHLLLVGPPGTGKSMLASRFTD